MTIEELLEKAIAHNKHYGDYEDVCRVRKYINQALAELDADGWVSVDERLPEPFPDIPATSAEVLVYNKDFFCNSRTIIATYNFAKKAFEWWSGTFCNLDENADEPQPTHWRPIVLPKEVK